MFKILFSAKPQNYKKIDAILSRSAKLTPRNMKWLKKDGITDIIDLRAMMQETEEEKIANTLGIKYHNIPSVAKYPKKENVGKFLDIIEGVKMNGGKAHVHGEEGADRTGMYSYIYERLNNIGTPKDNLEELKKHFWNIKEYPYLKEWAEIFISMIKK